MEKFFSRIFGRLRRRKGLRWVGRIDPISYDRHARSPEVQNLIESARRSWMERYGVDPAAARVARLERSREGRRRLRRTRQSA
jgi:hypothetical protein